MTTLFLVAMLGLLLTAPTGFPGTISIGRECEVCDGVRLKKKEKTSVYFGHNCFIGFGAEINCMSDLRVGNNVLIAGGVTLTDVNHHCDEESLPRMHFTRSQPIIIEDHVWIGSGATILSGVRLGEGSIIAAGSVVTKATGEWELWGGVPAKLMRKSLGQRSE